MSVIVVMNQRRRLLKYGKISVKKYLCIYLIFFLVGCSTTEHAKKGSELYLDQSILTDDNSATGWLAYGLGLLAWEPVRLDDGRLDYFNREVFARQSAAQVWKELKQKKTSSPDKDLDALEIISDAGFMDEYLWLYFNEDGWVDPGTLELEKFNEWEVENLVNHVPLKQTGVSVGE